MVSSDVTAIYPVTICFAQLLQATWESDLSLANIWARLLKVFLRYNYVNIRKPDCTQTIKYDIFLQEWEIFLFNFTCSLSKHENDVKRIRDLLKIS